MYSIFFPQGMHSNKEEEEDDYEEIRPLCTL